jgi:hypothetical protein
VALLNQVAINNAFETLEAAHDRLKNAHYQLQLRVARLNQTQARNAQGMPID